MVGTIIVIIIVLSPPSMVCVLGLVQLISTASHGLLVCVYSSIVTLNGLRALLSYLQFQYSHREEVIAASHDSFWGGKKSRDNNEIKIEESMSVLYGTQNK